PERTAPRARARLDLPGQRHQVAGDDRVFRSVRRAVAQYGQPDGLQACDLHGRAGAQCARGAGWRVCAGGRERWRRRRARRGGISAFFCCCDHCPPSAVRVGPLQPRSNGLERTYADDARRATSADGSRSAWVHSSRRLEKASQPRDTRSPARNPSRPFHGGWSAMPLMAYVPSRPGRAGPAKVIATAIEVLARAAVPSRRHCGALTVIPAKAGIARLRSLLFGVVEVVGRSGIGEAARLREGSAGAAHGWAAIRFPWPWRVFGMRAALPSTGELPPFRRPGGSPRPLSSYQPHPNTL